MILLTAAIITDMFHHLTRGQWIEVGTTIVIVHLTGFVAGFLMGRVRVEHVIET